ncbi:MAG: HAD family hydrolase [Natronincolaceae bacterium]|jgi:P-type E1-E2 ATPase|nr:HAD family hydrolase [Bacillota bacterium]NLK90022.1 HAD family hydrolase [Clostridiales bacterium]
MLIYDIPGTGEIKIENIVFDYNGTVAIDGKLIEGVKESLIKLKSHANIYILTADTYGTVKTQCNDLGIDVKTFPKENAGLFKKKIVEELGANSTICVGNGVNDVEMFKICRISIATVEGEGCSGKLLVNTDIAVNSIQDAVDLILSNDRMKATLRN